MTINDQIRDKKLQLTKKPLKYKLYHKAKLISINILLVKKY